MEFYKAERDRLRGLVKDWEDQFARGDIVPYQDLAAAEAERDRYKREAESRKRWSERVPVYWRERRKKYNGMRDHLKNVEAEKQRWTQRCADLAAEVARLREDYLAEYEAEVARLREFYEAWKVVDQGVCSFELHDEAVDRLKRAVAALERTSDE